MRAGDLLQFDDHGLRGLGRLEQLRGDLLHGSTPGGGRRLDRPLPHVGIEDVDHLEIGRDLQGDLVQFRAADGVGQGRAGRA